MFDILASHDLFPTDVLVLNSLKIFATHLNQVSLICIFFTVYYFSAFYLLLSC